MEKREIIETRYAVINYVPKGDVRTVTVVALIRVVEKFKQPRRWHVGEMGSEKEKSQLVHDKRTSQRGFMKLSHFNGTLSGIIRNYIDIDTRRGRTA